MVQSWFASVVFAGLEDLWGLAGIRVLVVVACALLGGACWVLTRRASSLLVRVALTGAALAIGADVWTHRPLLFGLLGLAATLVAAEGRLDPRFLVPIGWVWANSHGSWPLGLVALGCLWLGRRLDGEEATVELRVGAWLCGGLVLGALNPYGPALLLFPVQLLSRREALSGIVEWGPLEFTRPMEWIFVALLMAAVVGIRRHPTWRATVPTVVFGVAALTSLRNVGPATLVLLPALAHGLGDLGGLRSDETSPLARPLVVAGAVLGVLSLVAVVRTDDFVDDAYPVAADEWLRENGLHPAEHRVLSRDLVGNWFEVRYGATGTVFIDDRAEVIPLEVIQDYRELRRGAPGWDEILASYDPDAILWEVDSPLAELLEQSGDWSITYRDDTWLVAVPA